MTRSGGHEPGTDPHHGDRPIDAALLHSVTSGLQARVEHRPVDVAQLLQGAHTGAVRIRRRRQLMTTAAAVVIVSAPVILVGQDLLAAAGPTTAGGPSVESSVPPRFATPPESEPPRGAGPSPSSIEVPVGATGSETMTVTFRPRRAPVGDSAATTTRPHVLVAGGEPRLRARIAAALNDRIGQLVTAYGERLTEDGLSGRGLQQVVQLQDVVLWRHTASVVLDATEEYPDRTLTRTSAVVLDRRTGTTLAPENLFTDVPAVDKVMRAAIRAAVPSSADIEHTVATLSMRPARNRTTTGTTWYPTTGGLRWTCDPDRLPAAAGGLVDVTVGWTTLRPYLAATRTAAERPAGVEDR